MPGLLRMVLAVVACLLAPARSPLPAWAVGGLFFLGGCVAAAMLPVPLWFKALDLPLAYAPMAWLALRLVSGRAEPRI